MHYNLRSQGLRIQELIQVNSRLQSNLSLPSHPDEFASALYTEATRQYSNPINSKNADRDLQLPTL
jgi:hypothetical protein